MKKTIQIIFISLVLLLLFGFGILTLFCSQTQPGEYAPWENRKLAERPVLTSEKLFDGSYFSDIETYLSDHLYARTSLLRANVQLQQLSGCVSVNGVIDADGVLLLDNGIYDKGATDWTANAEQITKQLSAVRDVTEQNGGTFLYVGLPTQRNVFESRYPGYLNSDRERTDDILSAFLPAMEKQHIDALFLEDAFRQSVAPETLYSPVDHHFTLKGANLCVRAVEQYLNDSGVDIPMPVEERFGFEALSNPMLGTYNRKLYGCTSAEDSMLIYQLTHDVPYERWDNGVRTDAPVIDLPQTETEFVQYSAYMGGDKAETVIKTNRPELKKLLVVGDSFTNAMEPILYLSFDEMRSLDFRYYTEKTLTEYITDYQPDVVLIIRDSSVYLSTDGNGDLR